MPASTRSSRPPLPPTLRRLLWWAALVMAVSLVVIVACLIFIQVVVLQTGLLKPGLWMWVSIPAFLVALVFVGWRIIWPEWRRANRDAAAAPWRKCVRCAHDLNGLGETGACPGCGRPFDIAADQDTWAWANLPTLPPAVLRLLWWAALVPPGMAAGWLLVEVGVGRLVGFGPGVFPAVGLLIPAVMFAPIFVAWLLIRRGWRRIKRAVAATTGRACLRCLYDLSGLEQTGACPECGRPFDIAADQFSWALVDMHPMPPGGRRPLVAPGGAVPGAAGP